MTTQNDDEVKCMVCGGCFKTVTYKHLKHHNMTLSDYKLQFPEAPLDSVTSSKKRCADKLTQFIGRYGEVEGLERYKSHCKKMRDKNLFETKQQKYGWSEDDFAAYNKRRAVTLENQQKKHGDVEGAKRFKEYCDKQSVNGNKLEYFVEKYGEIDGLKKYQEVNKKKAITLENLIAKYGEVDGKTRYEKIIIGHRRSVYDKMLKKYGDELAPERYKEWIDKHTTFSRGSRIQETFISSLISEFPHLDFYSCLTKEFALQRSDFKEGDGKYWLYDLVLTNPTKLLIEFNGDFWHANPKRYKSTDILNFPKQVGKTAEELWDKDAKKMSDAEKCGFVVKTVWESDFNDAPEKVIEECKEWILQKLK